jgi:predicted DNA-binding transcriptional regulator AlpA
MTSSHNRFLRAPEAAAYLRLSTSTLPKMRLRGDGPLYTKLGPRLVAYEQQHLDQWLEARLRRSTSDAGPQHSQGLSN